MPASIATIRRASDLHGRVRARQDARGAALLARARGEDIEPGFQGAQPGRATIASSAVSPDALSSRARARFSRRFPERTLASPREAAAARPRLGFGPALVAGVAVLVVVSLGYVLAFVASFLVAGVAVLAMTHALHAVPAEETPVLIASYSLGFAAGVIGFVLPGTLGARKAGVALALTTVVPATVALAVALVVRFAQMAIELLYAGAMPVLARRRP